MKSGGGGGSCRGYFAISYQENFIWKSIFLEKKWGLCWIHHFILVSTWHVYVEFKDDLGCEKNFWSQKNKHASESVIVLLLLLRLSALITNVNDCANAVSQSSGCGFSFSFDPVTATCTCAIPGFLCGEKEGKHNHYSQFGIIYQFRDGKNIIMICCYYFWNFCMQF